MSRVVAHVAAFLAPLLLLGAAFAWLARPEPPPASTGDLPDDVAAVARRIDGGADVVILGNSKVDTDLDVAQLAALARVPEDRVVKLNLNGTNAPIWYAVLQRRVYDQGHRPKLVIVYSTLAMMAQVAMESESLKAQLARHLGTPDPVIDEKVYGKERVHPVWARATKRRTEAHTHLMDTLRDTFVGLVFAPPGEGSLAERGAAVAGPALANVFNSDAMWADERVRAIPIAERAESSAATRGPADADATVIPDLVRLAKANGAEIVFVRGPMGSLKFGHDAVPRALEESVVAKMGELGAAWVDLSQSGPGDSGYGDGSHMSRAGRGRFMPKVIAGLKAVGVGTGKPLKPASVLPARPPPRITRLGDPPPIAHGPPRRGKLDCDWLIVLPEHQPIADNVLAAARIGAVSPVVVYENDVLLRAHATPPEIANCSGASTHFNGAVKLSPTGSDPEAVESRSYRLAWAPALPLVGAKGVEAWWVYPGTTLRFEFDARVAAGALSASIRGRPLLPGTGGVTTRIDGGPDLSLVAAGESLVGVATGDVSGAFTLEITSPADGPTLLLDSVALKLGEETWFVIGNQPGDGLVEVLAQPVTFGGPPAELPAPSALPTEAPWKKGAFVFPVGDIGAPPMEDAAKIGSSCSALRLTIDGVPAQTQVEGAPPKTPLAAVTHSKDRLVVRFNDAAHPSGDPSRYRVLLDPDRRCGARARWIYPGDEARFDLQPSAFRRVQVAATTLSLAGGAFHAGPDDRVRVSVTAGEEVFLDAEVPLARFGEGDLELALQRPLPRGATAQVVVRSSGWLLLTFAGLVEPAPDLFAVVAR